MTAWARSRSSAGLATRTDLPKSVEKLQPKTSTGAFNISVLSAAESRFANLSPVLKCPQTLSLPPQTPSPPHKRIKCSQALLRLVGGEIVLVTLLGKAAPWLWGCFKLLLDLQLGRGPCPLLPGAGGPG